MIKDFVQLRRKARTAWEALTREGGPLVLVGTATCGRSAGSLTALDVFRKETEKRRTACTIVEVGCIGTCYIEPVVCITKPGRPGICYGTVTPERARELVEKYIVKDDPLPHNALGTIGEGRIDGIPKLFETDVFKRQVRRTLRNCGFIDPTNIMHYIAHDGYTGLQKAISMRREKIIEQIKEAGLRGRGGAGFPTWKKWQFAANAKGEEKYLVCNADEGDPGAFMNRSLIEGDPHSLLEGMIIAGYTLGATEGYIYCRAEYPLALERLKVAIAQAKECHMLGDAIMGSDFSFHITVKEGAGAFVCGEETALIASLQGERGMPRPRPPFPAVSGLWKRPTVINNVETLVCVALILQNGAEWFAEYGSEKSKGTKTFALVGKVKRTGLVEVPFGTTLRQMIYDIGGGVFDDRKFKAVQTGGPSGGCVPASLLDMPVDYDSLKEAGTIMGSGGMVVMDESTCMVDFARYFLDFAQKESCGKCIPCRLGTKQLLEILEDITRGAGTPEDIDLLVRLGEGIKKGALCGLGQTAPNPVLTTIRYFRDEYEAHARYNRCPAVVCKEIISSPCQHTCPINTEAATYISLIARKRYREAFDVILKDNPLPSVCGRVCHHPCEATCQAGRWGDPISIRALKRFATERAFQKGDYPRKRARTTRGKPVAIIGSGPAGLTAGYELAKKGYRVTIYEALSVAGGGLAVYIPEYRLPKEILKRDIEHITKAGVTILTDMRVGKDIAFDEIVRKHEAVFIATGAHRPRKMDIEGERAAGVLQAIAFLHEVNLGRKVRLGKRVGIVGGGNAAVDAARVAKRMKDTEEVCILYRRTRNEMPAFREEVDAAIEEGVAVEFLTAPGRIIEKNGRFTALECLRMELGEVDESGRRRPVPIQDSAYTVRLDSLIVAIGEGVDTSFLGQNHGIAISKRGTLTVDPETLATQRNNVFAGGDAVTGPNTAIEAMSHGKRAAAHIHNVLTGKDLAGIYPRTRPSFYVKPVILSDKEVEEARRPAMPSLPASKRRKNFSEVDLSLKKSEAIKEARRCLRCDLETEDAKRAPYH
jgi:NADH-quinone oxidoreductase subunit F